LNLQNTLRVEGTSVLPDFRITHFDDYQAYLGHQETRYSVNSRLGRHSVTLLIHLFQPHFDDYQAYLGHQETNSESDEAAELSFEQLLKDKSAAAKAE